MKSAVGSFEIKMEPREDPQAPVGRFVLNKAYTGELEGTGLGQMISKRLENGTAIYFAIEEFSGKVHGQEGSFTLVHHGTMDASSQTLDIKILKGSGSLGLETISGSLNIEQKEGQHFYTLSYEMKE